MNLVTREENNAVIFELDGEVDLETSPKLRQALLDQVNTGKDVIVCMKEVSYIDSSGIASLVEAYQTARRNQTGFALADISESALRVLQLARLDKVFSIHDGVADALKSLAS